MARFILCSFCTRNVLIGRPKYDSRISVPTGPKPPFSDVMTELVAMPGKKKLEYRADVGDYRARNNSNPRGECLAECASLSGNVEEASS